MVPCLDIGAKPYIIQKRSEGICELRVDGHELQMGYQFNHAVGMGKQTDVATVIVTTNLIIHPVHPQRLFAVPNDPLDIVVHGTTLYPHTFGVGHFGQCHVKGFTSDGILTGMVCRI